MSSTRRRPLVAGNWKMNLTLDRAVSLASRVAARVEEFGPGRPEVLIAPPFPFLNPIATEISGSGVALAAQTLNPNEYGAYTGEVSAEMLVSVGCSWVIVGHSERRSHFGEDEIDVAERLRAAMSAGLNVILCVGESRKQREDGEMKSVLHRQLTSALDGVTADGLEKIVIAYEPVWAIGTGDTATPETAELAHLFIRNEIATLFAEGSVDDIRILYGGSVKPENADELFAEDDIDGALVGGASLDAESFVSIVRLAMPPEAEGSAEEES